MRVWVLTALSLLAFLGMGWQVHPPLPKDSRPANVPIVSYETPAAPSPVPSSPRSPATLGPSSEFAPGDLDGVWSCRSTSLSIVITEEGQELVVAGLANQALLRFVPQSDGTFRCTDYLLSYQRNDDIVTIISPDKEIWNFQPNAANEGY